MIDLNTDLPPELAPLSWLVGVWEGTGVIDYTVGDDKISAEFGQRVSFSNDGLPVLNYSSYSWLLDDENTPLATELGYWRIARDFVGSDHGPALLPGVGDSSYDTAEKVETLRNAEGAFDIEVSVLQSSGVSELYLGQVKGPRIDLATDAVVRGSGAKPYSAATRLYGLVDAHLLWAWDIAALGQDLRSHASARLQKVS